MSDKVVLDHTVVSVNDMHETIEFWYKVLGFKSEGEAGPFTVLRISPELTFQMAPWGTKGGGHFAFAMSAEKFESVFNTIKQNNIAYGDSFHAVGNQQVGEEIGARGLAKSIYFNDPNEHLLEIRCYE